MLIALAALVAAEVVSANALDVTVSNVAGWVANVAAAAAAGLFCGALYTAFTHRVTLSSNYEVGELPAAYRVGAWSLVLLALLAFGAAIWFTVSRGLVAW